MFGILWRALVVSCMFATVAVLFVPPTSVQRRLLAAAGGVACFLPFALAYTLLAAVNDYRQKKPLGQKYDMLIRWGSDAIQERRLRIDGYKNDLLRPILCALHGIADDIVILERSPGRFEARRPPRRRPNSLFPERLGSFISVELKQMEVGSAAIIVRSRVDAPLVWGTHWSLGIGFDLGQSIENVEEFQRWLQRLLGNPEVASLPRRTGLATEPAPKRGGGNIS